MQTASPPVTSEDTEALGGWPSALTSSLQFILEASQGAMRCRTPASLTPTHPGTLQASCSPAACTLAPGGADGSRLRFAFRIWTLGSHLSSAEFLRRCAWIVCRDLPLAVVLTEIYCESPVSTWTRGLPLHPLSFLRAHTEIHHEGINTFIIKKRKNASRDHLIWGCKYWQTYSEPLP